jgi:hypothetical protein
VGTGAVELDGDGDPSEVGAHGEVGDGGDHGDTGGDVVEGPVSARLGVSETEESKGRKGHDGADGVVPEENTSASCACGIREAAASLDDVP